MAPQPLLFFPARQGEPWAGKWAPNHGLLCVLDKYLWGLLNSVAWSSSPRPSESGRAASSQTPAPLLRGAGPGSPTPCRVGDAGERGGSSALETPDRANLPASTSFLAPIPAYPTSLKVFKAFLQHQVPRGIYFSSLLRGKSKSHQKSFRRQISSLRNKVDPGLLTSSLLVSFPPFSPP